MHNREIFSKTAAEETWLFVISNKIPTRLVKTSPGNVLITIPDLILSKILPNDVIKMLSTDPKLWDQTVIGRFEYVAGKEKLDFKSWPFVDHPLLNHLVSSSIEKFLTLIDMFGKWQDFGSFLHYNLEHNPKSDPVNSQPPFEYFWLTGPLKSNGVKESSIFDDRGIFVRPKDKLLPVFSNSLFADMAAQIFSEKDKIELMPSHISCLGCFLSGISGELGRRAIEGGILDGQWNIKFFSCNEVQSHTSPRHFSLIDQEAQYALINCRDHGSMPIWAEKKWEVNCKWFNPKCNPVPW